MEETEPLHVEDIAGIALLGPGPEPPRSLGMLRLAVGHEEKLFSKPHNVLVLLKKQLPPLIPHLPKEVRHPPFPIGKENTHLLLVLRAGTPAGVDGSRGVRDIFCHRTAESGVFFGSIEPVHPDNIDFAGWGLGCPTVYSG